MPAVSGRVFLVSKPAPHSPGLHLLVPQGRNGSDGNGASEVIGGNLRGL